jgi:hypothetical protein
MFNSLIPQTVLVEKLRAKLFSEGVELLSTHFETDFVPHLRKRVMISD